MKIKLPLLCICFLIFTFGRSQSLFFDDFETDISVWTTQNTITGAQWYCNSDEGYNGSKSVSFTLNLIKPYDVNDAWLITPEINVESATNVKVNFKYMRWGDYLNPRLYFTNNFTGNVETTIWTEIEDLSWGTDVLEYYDIRSITIETPGNRFWFAFRYETTEDIAAAFYIDNFSIESYTPPEPSVLVGSSDHFEFYTNLENQTTWYAGIENILEERFLNYNSLWIRPDFDPIFPSSGKIKIDLISRDYLKKINNKIAEWDCGSIDPSSGTIYLCPFETIVQQGYYNDLTSLSVNEFSQLSLAGWFNFEPEYYYLEGFGLYEMGYRPDRDNLIKKLDEIGTNEPQVADVTDVSALNLPGNKDLLTSLFESKVLLGCYFYNYNYNDLYNWWQLLKHYYIKQEDRIRLIYSSDHFDIYGAEKETTYSELIAMDMEEQFALQENRFNIGINHRINICIYDNEVGLEITNRTDFQGLACGADKINTLPLHDPDHFGLLHHEFMHAMVNMLSNFNPAPGQFLNEGLAESSDGFMTNEEMPSHAYKIQDLFYHYQRKYNREPTWLEIVDNAEVSEEDGFWVDAYALGEMYWRYMNDKYPDNFWKKVKLFLQNGRDWSAFGGKTTDEEGAEFIQFMKELAFVGPPLGMASIPFIENFRNDFYGWTLMRYNANDYWRIQDNTGYDDRFCAFAIDPYWLEEKDVDSWLVTPPMDASGYEKMDVNFMYKQTGQGIKPEIYYTREFAGPTENTNWIPVEDIYWNGAEGQWTEMKFTILNPPGKLFIALRFQSNEGNYASYCIDNFEVKAATSIELSTVLTKSATDITTATATINGEVTSDGGATITQRGFYWSSTNPSPNANDHTEIIDGTTNELSFELTGLSPSTTYYYRTYATNSVGTALGEVKQFTTLENIETMSLPFVDDFEDEDDADFYKWTTENIEGWQYWHVIAWGGNNGSHCMRFEICDTDQNDWLITKPIDCSTVEKLKVNFDILYSGNGPQPTLYYTNSYTGDASQSNWTEINYMLVPNENEWHSVDEIVIDKTGDVIYFAFQYHSTPQNALFCLLDNFSVKEYVELPEYVKVGSSTHFDFYSNMSDKASYYLDIQDGLEAEFIKLNSHWNRPGQEKVFEDNARVDVYYSLKENQPGLEGYLDSWRCGFYLSNGSALYLTPLLTNEQVSYYKDLSGEAVHTFSKMALRMRMARDAGQVTSLPNYFGEGFGLYEIGYRPDRDSIISFLSSHPGDLDHNSISNISDITTTSKKDMIVSYVEGQILLPLGYRSCAPNYGSFPPIWNNYLKYFYNTTDEVQIKKQASSENFDIYCSSRDIEYTDSMLVWLERTLKFYSDSFQIEFNNRFNLVVLFDEKTGMDLTGYDNFNGGSGGLNISPHNFYDGIEGYPWLLAHEFGHVFNDYMYYDFPFGFYHEGMANFSGFRLYGVDWMESKPLIKQVFDFYQNNYLREPTLEEFANNPDNEIDPYFFGLQFIRYLNTFSDLLTIKEFFSSGLDFSVFNKTEKQIETGYIDYLKGISTSNPLLTKKKVVVRTVHTSNQLVINTNDADEKINSIEIYLVNGQKRYSNYSVNKSETTIRLLPIRNAQLVKVITNGGMYVQNIFY